jgi:lysophospholipid acyltransferase (LPLAT)-like uncharacterized protein
MAKFRLRDLIASVPALDRLRINVIAEGLNHGMSFLDRSYDVAKVYPESVRPYVEGEKPAIFTIYHGRMAQVLWITPREKFRILVSQSRDGECVAGALAKMGIRVLRGSSGRDGASAVKNIIKSARAGESLVLTVDGPRGPIHEVKIGAIRLAEMTGLPIIPSLCSANQYTQMWGWDKFMITEWGSPEIYLYAEPMEVGRGLTDEQHEELRKQLSDKMHQLRELSDSYWPALGSRQEINC